MLISPWSAARALLPIAVMLIVPAALAIAYRSAAPCSGSLRAVPSLSSRSVDALPVIADAVSIGATTRTPTFDTSVRETGTYALGDLRARYSFESDRGRPAPTSFEIEAPRSCDGGSINFTTGMYGDRWTLALRRAPSGGPYVVTWRESGVDSRLDHVAFEIDPPGPLRRLRRHIVALVVLLLGVLAAARARRLTVSARAYFGPAGIATWRAGRVDERGWVVPEGGSSAVRAALTDAAPGTPVVFSTDPAARVWTFRQMGGQAAAAVVVGSRAEIAARHAADAMSALLAAALAVIAAGSVLVALAW